MRSHETNQPAKVKLVSRRCSLGLGDSSGSEPVENFISAQAEIVLAENIKIAVPYPTSVTN